jgi:hypothetical protein
MTKFQIAIRKLGVHFSKPIWSFIVNCVFWLGHLNKIGEFRKIKADIKSLSIETLMERFVWVEDKAGDWTPWVMTIICQSFKDDCDGAANLAKWWFKQNGVEAEILNLYSATEGHAICVTKDRTKMVTNERVIQLFPETWEDDIMRYFKNKYEVII